jgi:heme-degrading monooxygenase HmoA
MARIWTHGVWRVKPGREDEFIRAWREFAHAAAGEFSDVSEPPTFLRSLERPNVFITFGAWNTLEDIQRFRESEIFRERVAAIRELLDDFEPEPLEELER